MSADPAGEALPPGYPVQWEHDVVVADGGLVHVRPIRPSDRDGLVRFYSRLSKQSIYFRFFSSRPHLSDKEIEYFTTLDYLHRLALVATVGDEIVAVARYEGRDNWPEAEVAFLVEDAHQGRGIGTMLLEALAVAARENGVEEFTAVTLLENKRMLGVFSDIGFPVTRRSGQGEVSVRFPVAVTAALAEAIARREHQSEALSVKQLLTPRSVAVVGVGREPGGVGHQVFRNLLAGGFNGPVYPIHHKAAHVGGVRAYRSVLDVPDEIDVAVICVPADSTFEVVRQCGEKGVRGVVIITAGFAETTAEAARAEGELLRLVRRFGMRMIGPNCMGVVNTAAEVSIHGTFTHVVPVPGAIGVASQSGALGIAVLERSAMLSLGISTFVSLGNKADVSTNDLLQYWEDDPATDVILVYVESFGNPGKFNRIARRVSRRKPIVAVKSGRSAAGRRVGVSRRGALVSPDPAVDALFRQTGVIRVATLEELFEVAQVLDGRPLPAGPRVAIVANAGGPGIVAADACETAGLEVPELSDHTQAALREFLPPAATVGNPVDMLPAATPHDYERAVRLLLDDPDVDALIVVFSGAFATRVEEVSAVLARAAAGATKPLVANLLGVEGMPPLPAEPVSGKAPRAVPSFPFPEAAARALGRAVEYAAWRAEPEGSVRPLAGVDVREARQLIDGALSGELTGGWIEHATARQVLAAFGLPVVAGDRDTEPGVELVLAVMRDESFGPVLTLGTGGSDAPIHRHRSVAVTPMTDRDADRMVRSLDSAPLLTGSGDLPAADLEALEDLLLRVAHLAEQLPEIQELEINRLVASPAGAVAADVRIRVAPSRLYPERDLRRLR